MTGRGLLHSERGQMCVELALLMPAAIVVALVIFNVCRFVEACAAFDRIAPDAVISQGVSPSGEQSVPAASAAVRSCIEKALGMRCCEVSVAVSGAQPQAGTGGLSFLVSPWLTTFTCKLRYRPWPSSFVLAGVPFSPPVYLTHTRSLVVDRFRPLVVVQMSDLLMVRHRQGYGRPLCFRVLTGLLERLRGLLATRPNAQPVALVGCSSIHTFGMAYRIDVAFLDAGGMVLRSEQSVPPGVVLGCEGACMTLERPHARDLWLAEGEVVDVQAREGGVAWQGE